MKAYSLDLRQKIVDVYHSEDISQRKLAKRFNVAPSFVQKILKQYRETGDCGPKVRQQQTQTKLNEEQLQILEQLVQQKNDSTLAELRQQLYEKCQVVIGTSTVDRMLKKLGFTLKKKSTRYRKRE